MSVLEIKGLSKAFIRKGEAVYALRDVSLTVASGEIVAIVGANGAGKTTLLKVIAGLLTPDTGEISWSGSEPPKVQMLLSSDRSLYRQWTVTENLVYFGILSGLSRALAHERAAELCRTFDIGEYRDEPLQNLSHGNIRRVELVSTLMSDPDVLILDEPTLGLDVRVASTLESIITGLAKSGKAILFSTHEVETAERLCDRLLLVSQGVIAFDGTVHSLRSTLNIARYEVTITDDELRDSVEHALRTHIPGLAVEQAEDSTFVIDTHGSVSLNAVVTAMMDRGIPFTAIRKSSVPIRKIVARILPEGEVALAPVKDEAAGAKPARRPLVPMTWDRTARQTMVLIPLEISLGFRMMRRYPLNTISSLIMLSLVFLGMVVGAGFLTGGGLSSLRLTTAVAGFAVWVTVLDGFSQFALGISQEAVRGTLEKLFQSVIPAQAILFARGIANVLPSLLSLSIFTIGLMLVSGSPLSLSPLMPITLGLALFASYGIGLALGGLALVAKRVDQLVSLLQFAVLPLLFIDPGTVSAAPVREALRFIPFSLATRLMSRLASGLGVALVEMLTLTVTSLALFAIGIACFKRATRVVKARGTLGHQ